MNFHWLDGMPSDVEVLVVRVPREAIAYVKCVFESYEDVAVTRTLDRHEGVACSSTTDMGPNKMEAQQHVSAMTQ